MSGLGGWLRSLVFEMLCARQNKAGEEMRAKNVRNKRDLCTIEAARELGCTEFLLTCACPARAKKFL
jgi:hypothetical protein